MGRRKVTYEIDETLARRVKATAVAEGKPEYRVVEEALDAHLLGSLLDTFRRSAGDLDPDEAMRIAIEEVEAVRAARGTRPARKGAR